MIGILVIGIGPACRDLQAILKQSKKYVVTGEFGLETDTLEVKGEVTCRLPFGWLPIALAACAT